MGNCQAVEVAAAVVQHPGRAEVERFYSPVSAQQVMASNPGHYVALVAAAPASRADSDGRTVAARQQQQLKLLRPGDSLMLGNVYCLISFEDVLKEFAAKKCAKLGKMAKQSGGTGHEYDRTTAQKRKNKGLSCPDPNSSTHPKLHNFSPVQLAEPGTARARGSSSRANVRGGGLHGGWRQYGGTLGGGQWRPALQSISEIGN